MLSADSSDYGSHPVATKKPNAYGIYDMSGNLFEWINDWYSDYTADSQADPTGQTEETWHFVRGGSWGNYASYLRSSNREFSSPDYYMYFVGFRVVLPFQSVTGIEENNSITPLHFKLDQNYPNPFNPVTSIQFSLPTAASVSLTIYNILGHEVEKLAANQMFVAGIHLLNFDATGLKSGVYWYRLQANDFVQTRKMILIK